MKKKAVLTILTSLLLIGCATLAEKNRMEKFGLITESFERALRMSDYTKAAKFIDPSVADAKPEFQKLRNYKIVEYKVTNLDVSEDKMKISQDVELQYFRLNGNILHSTRYPQTWLYKPDEEIWLLQGGLPDFAPQYPQPVRR